MGPKSVAIVGAGVSGLGAAWMLKRSGIQSVVYEKGSRIGGNAATIDVAQGNATVAIDIGVQYIVPMLYPNVIEMAKLLNVAIRSYPVSFTAAWDDENIFGTHQKNGRLWRQLEPEMTRFTFEMHELLGLKSVEVTSFSIGEYLRSNQYSTLFIEKVMGAVSGVMGLEFDHDYSSSMLLYVYAFCSNFLSFFSPCSTFAFAGGTRSFVQSLSADADVPIRLNCGVTRIHRTDSSVMIEDERGDRRQFDDVIITTDGELALKLLAEPTRIEQRVLSTYQTLKYPAVVHSDVSALIPSIDESKRTYLEIRDQVTTVNNCVSNPGFVILTSPLLTTYADSDRIDESRILHRESFRQDKGSSFSFEVKKNIHRIQGVNRTWFAGEGTTFASFETAMLSGFVIAEKLGAKYPFQATPRANQLFDLMKHLMLRGEDSFKIAF